MQDAFVSAPHRSAAREDALCAVSYLTPLPAAAMLLLPSTARNPRIRFHACQSILLNTLLMSAVFFLHLRADLDRLLDAGSGAQFEWTARLLCMAIWAFACLRLAIGKEFRVPVVAGLAAKQADGAFFQRFSVVDSDTRRASDEPRPALDAAILSR
jgi:uncharacterized membrane protein